MRYRNIALMLVFACCYTTANAQRKQATAKHNISGPAAWVNPFIGASTSTADAGVYHGLGKTFPGATTPYGMVQVSPNTITGGDNGSGYSYEHTSIEGFAFTQMSGIGWYGDLGNFLVMPTTGDLKTSAGTLKNTAAGYRSDYNKKSETGTAGYYSVLLTKYNIKAEMTAQPHSGVGRHLRQKGCAARQIGGVGGDADEGAPHAAEADDLRDDEIGGVGGDREGNALRAVDHGGVDADDLAGRRHQRPAGIAGVERGIGLDDVIDQPAGRSAHRAAECGDDA